MSGWAIVDPSGAALLRVSDREKAERIAEALHGWWGFPRDHYRVEPAAPGGSSHPALDPLVEQIRGRAYDLLGSAVADERQKGLLFLRWSSAPDEEAWVFLTEEELLRALDDFGDGRGARLLSAAFSLPTRARDLDDFIVRAFLFAPRVSRRRFPPRTHVAAWGGVPIAPGTSEEEARARGVRVLEILGAPEGAVQVHGIRRYGLAHEQALLEALDSGFWTALLERLLPAVIWGTARNRRAVAGVHHALDRMGVVATGKEVYREIPVRALVWYVAAAYTSPERAQNRLKLWHPEATSVKEALASWLDAS